MRVLKYAVMTMIAGATANTIAAEGMIEVQSAYGVKETITRFETAARERNLSIFLRVDHAAGAQKIGKSLRPTELLIFGNPQGGTPLMECAQTAGIDLPLKALAWEDASGQVWLGYNDPHHLVMRHGAKECGQIAQGLRKALDGMASVATK